VDRVPADPYIRHFGDRAAGPSARGSPESGLLRQ
jgi:hypothetical protein